MEAESKKSKSLFGRYFMLFLAALFWGISFVAQATDEIAPFTFTALRSTLGAIVLVPVFLIMDAIKKKQNGGFLPKKTKEDWKNLLVGGVCCGLVLVVATNLQQIGISANLEAGKAGFITAMYIVLVPVVSIFIGKRPHWSVFLSIAVAVAGLYLICVKAGSFSINKGDFYLIGCAVAFSAHIIVVDIFTNKTDGVRLSCVQFIVVAFVSLIIALITERDRFSVTAIGNNWIALLYMSLFSCGAAYTFQILGQKDTNPAVASLVMSFESCFAVLGGFVILHERLTLREGIGCLLMFVAVISTKVKDLVPYILVKLKKKTIESNDQQLEEQPNEEESK